MSITNQVSAIGRIGLLEPSAANQIAISPPLLVTHEARIQIELKQAGVTRYGLLKAESRYLHRVIRPDDHIRAVVYGRNREGSAMMVATDSRLVYLDKKPFFVKTDELTYEIVSGVMTGHSGLFTTVTLHTRMGDFIFRTMNPKSTAMFLNYIESRCLEYLHRQERQFLDKLKW